MATGRAKETIEETDRLAQSPRQPELKAGHGRDWFARAQHEGWYVRVDGHGAAPEEERRPDQIPEYFHDRNARRLAETALATGPFPSPGRGSTGYKGASKDKTAAKGEAAKGKGEGRPWEETNLEKPVLGSAGRLVGNDGRHLNHWQRRGG